MLIFLLLLVLVGCAADNQGPSSGAPVDDTDEDMAPVDTDDDPPPERDDEEPILDASTPDAPPEICAAVSIQAQAEEPDMLIVLDRSASMESEFQGGLFPVQTMRWVQAVPAIDQLTRALDQQVRFGLMVFPNESARCAAGALEVPVGLGTGAAISANLASHEPGGATPLALTLTEAKATLAADAGAEPRDKYVLLVTDGQPNCSASQSDKDAPDDDAAYAAMDALREAGVKSYVVGFDTGGLSVLDGLAQRGGTGETQHRTVTDEAGLLAALEAITGSAVSCTYQLDEPVSDPAYVRVRVDGTSYPFGPEGWTLDGDSTVKLEGPACQALRDGMPHEIAITVECEPVVIL